MYSVGGKGSPSLSTVDCWGGGREDFAAVKVERQRSRKGSTGRFA